MNRRNAIKIALATGLPLSVLGCSDDVSPEQYTQADKDLMARQQELERQNSGKGPFGKHVYQGYRGLADLPWFELDSEQRLVCVDESIPKAIDVHCHLGMSVLFEPELDLLKEHPRTRHLLDCDDTNPGCDLDLDIYVNGNFSEEALSFLTKTIVAQGLWGSDYAETQTIPNLLREMDAMRVERSVLLPIEFGFWFGDRQTEKWRDAVARANTDRLISGFSVSPDDKNAIADMERHVKAGARVMKLHPPVQRFFPDDPSLDELYTRAAELGVIVFYHGGRAGIESEAAHPYAMPRHYEATFKNHPNLQCVIGHGGARDGDAMLELALKYDNVWLGTHGQGITHLDKMIEATNGERLLFGTDWPFYHVGASLAKVLITTDTPGRSIIREKLLRTNALELLS
ncbi:MAG TPA: amidohydrolase [Gammaproteobacteria bacterium]|jgi:predicted TIM-barrel fold metal-dependent hydrolase|nr:amidohydrolase [Gammaproteobacteria bacterium]